MVAQLEVTNLSVNYGAHRALENASFTVAPASITGILGPNGAGKSTLLRATLGLVKKQQGMVTYAGTPPQQHLDKIGYVPQQNTVDWDFPATGADVVEMGTFGIRTLKKRSAARRAAAAALAQVGATEFAARPIGKLSGGQKQRIFLARALAKQPELLILDEPFQGVDAPSETGIMQVLRKLQAEGTTILMVHHDLTTASHYFSHVVLINKTVIAAGTAETVLTGENLTRTYGVQTLLDRGARG